MVLIRDMLGVLIRPDLTKATALHEKLESTRKELHAQLTEFEYRPHHVSIERMQTLLFDYQQAWYDLQVEFVRNSKQRN